MAKHLVTFTALIGRLGLNIAFLAILTACTSPQSFAGAENRLFSAASPSRGKIDEAMRSKSIRHRFVNVDFHLLTPNQEFLKNSNTVPGVLTVRLKSSRLSERGLISYYGDRGGQRGKGYFSSHPCGGEIAHAQSSFTGAGLA
jgi:hypothetical protein